MSDSENEFSEEVLKVVVLGDCCVGKTSLVKRYCNNEFSRQYFPTSGVDFLLKRLILQRNRTIVLKIWDVGGGSHTGSMLDKYVFGANIIKNILKHQNKKPMFALVGNKCDLEHQRVVKIEKHQRLANEFNLFPQIVSSRTGESVSLCFQKVSAEYLGVRLTKSEIEEHQSVLKAEISTYSDIPLQPAKNLRSPLGSAVCSLQ